jgi:hypothetical protein
MLDLQGFLEAYRHEHSPIRKPVLLDDVGALTAQATDPIVFENLPEHPRFRLLDNPFGHRRAQARILGCDPGQVVPSLAQVLRRRPKPLRVVDGGVTGDVFMIARLLFDDADEARAALESPERKGPGRPRQFSDVRGQRAAPGRRDPGHPPRACLVLMIPTDVIQMRKGDA